MWLCEKNAVIIFSDYPRDTRIYNHSDQYSDNLISCTTCGSNNTNIRLYFDGVEDVFAYLLRGDECDVPGWTDTYYFTKTVPTIFNCPENEITCQVRLDTYECDEYDTVVNNTDGDWSVVCDESPTYHCDSKISKQVK